MGSLIHVKEETSSPVIPVPKMSLLKISDQHSIEEKQSILAPEAPIVSSYNDRIRPLLDTVDRMRHLKIMQEGIQLPTIVVIGDQSSGKSTVLESLAGINLPRGQGICTRVPLIMRLQNHPNPNPDLSLEFNGKIVPTDEENIADAISLATEEIAGKGKGISNSPLTLVVKKNGIPNLTMVDLPGISRVPVHGQPEDIYEQISKIIMEYITPEESIILNVLSSTVDLSTCESIRMAQRVDTTGQRTLAVVNFGRGYVCLRYRIGDELYEEVRAMEARLFETHPQLSMIIKSLVGIPVLAEMLVEIQATIIIKCLPDIVGKINDKLSGNLEELNKVPKQLTSVAEAMTTFMHILGYAKESLRKILLQGEFDEYPDATEMHGTARLAEMLQKYSEELQSDKLANSDAKGNFLVDEIKILEEAKSIGLPNFLPKSTLQKKVKSISIDFVEKIWSYIENVVISVLLKHSDNYPQLLFGTRRAAHNLISKKKEQSVDWVNDMVEMEKLTNYTCNTEYMASCNNLINSISPSLVSMDGFGEINVDDLYHTPKDVVQEELDLKMRITAYWDIVMRRMVDNMALYLLFSFQNLVNKEMQMEIINELIGPQGNGLERMLEESPSISEKRSKLKKSIKLLTESKDVVANIMDRVVANFD